jgi:predicted adenine nucleotide alpha hydrolase (AANH) superfamily ATPase
MKVALHACCGPCLIEPLDDLASSHEVVVVYANPNIAPAEEYVRRRDTLLEYAAEIGAEVVELPYEPDVWHEATDGTEGDRAARCSACYRVRFTMSAEYAAANGFDAIATTLTISPHQDPEAIREEGERAAAQVGLTYLHRDYRERYPEATRRSRELEMYRQSYCGCLLSKAEAEAERAERRALRQAQRAARESASQRAPEATSEEL